MLENEAAVCFTPAPTRAKPTCDCVPGSGTEPVTARIVIPEGGADGVLIAQGGAYGGWSVYLTSGALAFAYNLGGVETEYTRSEAPLTPGEHEVRMHFAYDGGGLGKGGAVTLFDGDDQVATGRVTRTLPFFFSMDETVDIGSDLATPVSGDYGPTGNEFTSTIVWLRIDLGDDDHTHLADPEHRMQITMTRQ